MTQIYRIQVRGRIEAQQCINNMHWRAKTVTDAPLSTAAMVDMVTKIGDRWGLNISPFLHQTYSVVAYVISEITGWENALDSQGQPTGEQKLTITRNRLYIPVTGHPGEQVGEALPNTVASSTSFKTDRFGRRRQGRMKISPHTEANSTGNQLTTTHRGIIDTGLGVVLADVTPVGAPGDLESVVFSQTGLFQEALPGDPWGQCAPITDIVTSLTWGSQRSRKYNVDPS